jgi:NADH:ubiquinone oxidoreductase subunit B-like Fe-S oxidoreductase
MGLTDNFPGTVKQWPGGSLLVSSVDKVVNWSRSNSLWPLVFGTSCCAIEMMSAASAKHDWSRFGRSYYLCRNHCLQNGARAETAL